VIVRRHSGEAAVPRGVGETRQPLERLPPGPDLHQR
jgi:hypothetical protein